MGETSNFGMRRNKSLYEEYRNKWVIIYAKSNRTYAGRFKEVKTDVGILSPFQAGRYDDKGNFSQFMNPGRATFKLDSVECIEPSTKKNIENYCAHTNNKIKEQSQKNPPA